MVEKHHGLSSFQSRPSPQRTFGGLAKRQIVLACTLYLSVKISLKKQNDTKK